MGNDIVILENKKENLDLLAAQKQLYIIAKRIFTVQIFFTSVLVALLSIANLWIEISTMISIYSIVIAFIDILIFREWIKHFKEKAASMQEKFDTTVLSIPKNSLIEGIDLEEVIRYAKKYKKKDPQYSKLINWYSDSIKQIDSPVAKIICQRSSSVYDYTLRKNYNLGISIILGLISLTVFTMAALNETKLVDFLLIGVLPILPILLLFLQLFKDNRSSIKNLYKLKSYANDIWEKVIETENLDLKSVSRVLQDKIYQNRIESPLIFEWFYNLKRKKMEEEMNYCVDTLVKEYIKVKT